MGLAPNGGGGGGSREGGLTASVLGAFGASVDCAGGSRSGSPAMQAAAHGPSPGPERRFHASPTKAFQEALVPGAFSRQKPPPRLLGDVAAQRPPQHTQAPPPQPPPPPQQPQPQPQQQQQQQQQPTRYVPADAR
eukprot:6869450-Prymnesium_polylepis.1